MSHELGLVDYPDRQDLGNPLRIANGNAQAQKAQSAPPVAAAQATVNQAVGGCAPPVRWMYNHREIVYTDEELVNALEICYAAMCHDRLVFHYESILDRVPLSITLFPKEV